MAIKKGFELFTPTKRYAEINGDLWVFPDPRSPRKAPHFDRLEGVQVIPAKQAEELLEVLMSSLEE